MNSGNHQTVQRRRHTVAGTLLTILLVAAWLMAAGVLGGSGSESGSPAGPGSAPHLVQVAATSYVVQPGDTLWSVARSLQPSGDVRPLVDRLSRRTDAGRLRPGQAISLH